MTPDFPSLLEQFHSLAESYARRLPRRLAGIEAAWSQLSQASWDETTRGTLQRMVHTLKGSGGTFGFPAITAAATALEDSLERGSAADGTISHTQRHEVARQISKLRRAADDAGRLAASARA